MLTREISLQRSPTSIAAILNMCSTARPLRVTSFRPRDFVLASVSVLEVMADRQPYRFEPERVPNAEDRESENEEVNDRLEGTFRCTRERCETMATQRECVCCRKQPASENKMEAIISILFCIGRSHWKNNFLCKLFRY